MTEFNKQKKQAIVIDFDQSIYTLKAIKRAMSDFSDRADSAVEYSSQGNIRVLIFPFQRKSAIHENIERLFKSLVSDHQINLEVEEDFKDIRKIIVAQAFFPCDNLKEVLDEIDHDRNV